MGCGVYVEPVTDVGALTMVGQEGRLPRHRMWWLLRLQGLRQEGYAGSHCVKGEPVQAAHAEVLRLLRRLRQTSYARLVTQLFGDRMAHLNATGCSSIWGRPRPYSPYCTDKNSHGFRHGATPCLRTRRHGFRNNMSARRRCREIRWQDRTSSLPSVDPARTGRKPLKWLDTGGDDANAEATKNTSRLCRLTSATVDGAGRCAQVR